MTPKPYRITITDLRKPVVWLRRLFALATLVFLPISIGVYVGSSAMQWAGFVFGILFAIAIANQDKSFATKQEAIAHIESLED
ncbi:hypothetical protein G6M86_03630 [Agrobacterium tumefaciens]|uniref:Uncharacterized protein n=1 Tax=Agrobacterium tumefaciens TaxID=358 RepID=A0AAJ4T944_AGRTU|nr:hypothetical protein G6M86_03630 [Agrobacterium tumefaciens]